MKMLFLAVLAFYVLLKIWKIAKENKIKRWRKNLKIGDRGFFVNMLSGKTFFEVKDVDGDEVRIESKHWSSSSVQWMQKKELYPEKL